VQWLIQTGREARSVREPLRFTAAKVGSDRTVRYRLRESGLAICLRHGTRDLDILREIYGGGAGGHCYAPPEPIAAELDRRGEPAILDLGGHIGLFGAYVLGRWQNAQVTSYEPDPDNARLLARTIRLNGLEDRWRLVRAAVATRAGRAGFASARSADSHLAGPGEAAIDVATADLFELDHHVELLKMDIEGGEWPILLEPRLNELGARAVLLEWHGRQSPEPDAHAAVLRLLRNAGYDRIQDAGRDREADVGVLWAWRTAGPAGARPAVPALRPGRPA
jgi:FkbM family methyltransferase